MYWEDQPLAAPLCKVPATRAAPRLSPRAAAALTPATARRVQAARENTPRKTWIAFKAASNPDAPEFQHDDKDERDDD
jgi:hypothetical protein